MECFAQELPLSLFCFGTWTEDGIWNLSEIDDRNDEDVGGNDGTGEEEEYWA